MTTPDLARPLSAAELDELEAFLTSEATPEDCMDLETLDGFLTCIVSGPEAIMPGEWLPWVWSAGGDAQQGPEFADEPQARRILELLMRHMNGIAATLLNSPADFEPVLYEPEDEAERLPLARRWCLGYLTALGLREPAWAPLTEHEERVEVMVPIFVLAAEEDDPELGAAARDPAQRSRLAEMLPASAIGIHGFWLARRSGWTLPRRNPEKVGRNDPCPCGSGKKYKQCCGGRP